MIIDTSLTQRFSKGMIARKNTLGPLRSHLDTRYASDCGCSGCGGSSELSQLDVQVDVVDEQLTLLKLPPVGVAAADELIDELGAMGTEVNNATAGGGR